MIKRQAHYRSENLLKKSDSPRANGQLNGSYHPSTENYSIHSPIKENGRWKAALLPEIDEKYRQILSNPNQISYNTHFSRTRGEILQKKIKKPQEEVNEEVISGYEQRIEELEFLSTSLKEENDYLRAKLLEQFNIQVKNAP